MWFIIAVWCVEDCLKDLVIHSWCCITIVLLWFEHCYGIGHLLIICVNMSFVFETWLWQVLCELRKNKKLKRMHHFKDMSHVVMDIMIRRTYRTPQRTLLSRVMSHAAINALIDMYLMGPTLRNTDCVSLGQIHINIYLSFVNLWVPLVELMNHELDYICCWSIIVGMLLLSCVLWNCELLCWAGFMQVVVVEVRLGW